MSAYNKVILVGRMVKDADIRMTTNGTNVGKFTLAVNRQGKNKEVDFINCVVFGKTCSLIDKYVTKGSLILVEGSLQINKWTDKNNNKKYNPEIFVNSVQFLETKKKNSNNINNDDNNFDDPFANLDSDLSDDNPFGDDN